jgi:hypothetical protein
LREPMCFRTRDIAVRHFNHDFRGTAMASIRFALIFRWSVMILLQLENGDDRNQQDSQMTFSSIWSFWSTGSESRFAQFLARSTITRSQIPASWS